MDGGLGKRAHGVGHVVTNSGRANGNRRCAPAFGAQAGSAAAACGAGSPRAAGKG
ncbi:hypothetical protein BURMUCF2_A0439, partial [Burkholderia multivorans CF2]